MAGGKETPRQKMIGMMYLVLTALLALNVSKSILDAFINIEANVAAGNVTEVDRGDEKKAVVSEKLNDTTASSNTAANIFAVMEKIDKVTADKIQLIDKVKLLIFQAIGEDLNPDAELPIMIKDRATYDPDFDNADNPGLKKNNSDPVKPLTTNLNNVQKKDAYDEQMLIMGINESIQEPNKEAPGFAVWPAMIQFRKQICDLIVEASTAIDEDGKKYSFKDPNITKFADIKDLDKQLKIALKASNVNEEDKGIIMNVYKGLTKNEMQPDPHEGYKDDGTPNKLRHWVGGTFDHAPAVAAIAALSGLQSEVLTARADVMAYLSSKVGGGNYAFNKVQSLAYAPPSVSGGTKHQFTVMMAAYDSEKQPIVTPDAGKGTLDSTGNGRAYLSFDAPQAGEIELTGTIAIKDKFGNLKPAKYSTKVMVVEKAGAVSLPEVSVVYTDWPNKVAYTAAGVVTSDISCSGCSRTRPATWRTGNTTYKGKEIFVAKGQRTVKINLTGKDSKGETVPFGSFTYNVKSFPKPVVLTPSLSKDRGGFLNVGLPPSSPLQGVSYTILGGDINGSGFNSNRVSAANLASIKRGKTAGIYLRVKRSDNGKVYNIVGAVPVK